MMFRQGRGVSRREWLAAIAIALGAVMLMQVPYALGYALAPANTEYTGLLVNIEDLSYHAIMLQGYEGAWQYHIQFTPEAHDPVFMYGFYLFLGHVARTLNVSIVAMWHAARVIAALGLFLVVFGFIARFLADPWQRRVAFLMAVFGSGLDWVTFPWERFDVLGGTPVDFRMPEIHLFYTALTFPHVAVGIALTLVSFWLVLEGMRRRRLRWAAMAGIVNVLLGVIYPFLILLIGCGCGGYWLYRSWRARRIEWWEVAFLVIAFAIPLPLYGYYALVLTNNDVFRAWNAQATTWSPNPLHYALAYGVMVLLAASAFKQTTGARDERSGQKDAFALLWIWLAAVALLVYVPIPPQRRFVQGVQVPLAILAAVGLCSAVLPRVEQSRVFRALVRRPGYSAVGLERMIVALFLLVLSTANLVVLLRLTTLTALEQPAALFRPRPEVQAADWLHQNSTRRDIVLAAYPTGAYIPARAGNAVFVGQRYETMNYAAKLADVDRFFARATDDQWRQDLLTRYQISYVAVGPSERALGSFDPGQAPYLQQAWSSAGMSLYRVVR